MENNKSKQTLKSKQYLSITFMASFTFDSVIAAVSLQPTALQLMRNANGKILSLSLVKQLAAIG